MVSRRRLANGRQREALFIDMQRIDTALHRLNDGDFPAATKTSLGEARFQAPLASLSRYRASGYSTWGCGVVVRLKISRLSSQPHARRR